MIRLTKLTDYGIVLMTHLAAYRDRRWNAADLASETQLPAPMVSTILKQLVREGLLDSKRGAKGGYSLEKSAKDISVVDIITALDGPIALTECSDETTDECSYEAICRVKSHWLKINSVVRDALVRVTLDEMARDIETLSMDSIELSTRSNDSAAADRPLITLGR